MMPTDLLVDPAIAEAARRNRAIRLAAIAKLRPVALAARSSATAFRDQRKGASETKAEIETVSRLTHLPDFFPTPRSLVQRILDEAGVSSGMEFLEPEAGKGDIARAAHARGANVSCCEISSALREILANHHLQLIGYDFLELQPDPRFDAIGMNPPFSNMADIDHVRHAYRFLKQGARLVAIMSEGPFFRSDRRATEFRDWLDSVGGDSEQLPSDTFSSAESFRSTSVQTRIVTITR
jgi:hypothetical protein